MISKCNNLTEVIFTSIFLTNIFSTVGSAGPSWLFLLYFHPEHKSNPVDAICPRERCFIVSGIFPKQGLFAELGRGRGAQRPVLRVYT